MRIFKILLVFGALFSLTGCDFFRMLAGRPTSAEIEGVRTEIERMEQEAVKARQDSLERVRVARVKDSLDRIDSIAALDSIVEKAGPLLTPAKFKGVASGEFKSRYYIGVGAFKSLANANSFKKKTEEQGYDATVLCFKNGMCVVGVCPTDNIREAQRALKKVSEDSFFPKGAWVLVKE